MKRYFFSGNFKCKAGCVYCFAKWRKKYSQENIFDIKKITEKDVIIYPYCDNDITLENIDSFVTTINNNLKNFNSLYISISYKNTFNSQVLDVLCDLNRLLIAKKKGFIKASFSISTKNSINKIEHKCSQYLERIDMLKLIQGVGIKTSITIKPVLPFIPVEEYNEIIYDTKFIGKYLLGGLYINKNSHFFNKYIKNNFKLEKRFVNWLSSKCTVWDYIEDSKQMNNIKTYINDQGLYYFDSDLEVIKHMAEEDNVL